MKPSGPVVRAEFDKARAVLAHLSWDTEGGDRAARNLLGTEGVVLRVLCRGERLSAPAGGAKVEQAGGRTVCRLGDGRWNAAWSVLARGGEVEFSVEGEGGLEGMELAFNFDPRTACVTALASRWDETGRLMLPAVISAPDFGAMLLSTDVPGIKARLEGRRNTRVDLVLELPAGGAKLRLSPAVLPPPRGFKDTALWPALRRGWMNAFQATSRWGDQNKPYSSPPGILGNNVVSDPASCSIPFYSDMALFVPELPGGISIAQMVRRTVEWWLDNRMDAGGELVGYWNYRGFPEANTGPIIGAWGFVESSGDLKWLAGRIEQLEKAADFLAGRDVDADGLIEARHSGNAGALIQPKRSDAWFDAVNCGHKDAYVNAHVYRAWRCLAELEHRLERPRRQARYTRLADRLKAAYARTFMNDKTGWLTWWKSADGNTHDYASPIVNGIAIEYGLLRPEQGRQVLARLRAKMKAAGFDRFDLGVPVALIPIRREDYLLPNAPGTPTRPDGSDTFGQYMNGGITAGQSLHFLAAHYVVGEPEPADAMLRAMLGRQERVGFQNGAVNAFPRGIDWTDWKGNPVGYEGYLADVYLFQLAGLLREPTFAKVFYRPLAGK